MEQILPYLLCSALYAAVASALVRVLSHPGANRAQRPAAWHLATVFPLAIHTFLIYRSVFHGDEMYMGVGNSISAIIWLTVLMYWLAGFFYRLEGLQVLIAGAAAVLVWAPLLLPSMRPLGHRDLPAFPLHFLIALVAFSLFIIAFLQ